MNGNITRLRITLLLFYHLACKAIAFGGRRRPETFKGYST